MSALIIVEGWYFVIVNHCEKVLLSSFLSFKGQGLKLRDDNFGTPTDSLDIDFILQRRGP